VSAKIQQLLNTLKRPKRRHLEEFYEDDDVELEMAANPKDPNAPSPEGSTMMPAAGPQLVRPFKMSNKQKNRSWQQITVVRNPGGGGPRGFFAKFLRGGYLGLSSKAF
jgi:hypothetical protein